jgi:hypothetical protein
MGDNTTTSRGGQEQDATRGGGGGEGKLVDMVLTRVQEAEAAWRDAMQQVFYDGAYIGIVFAISGRGISQVNPPWIMHTLGGNARGHGGSGKIFVGGRKE